MQTEDLVAADSWLSELIERHRGEIDLRHLAVHRDIEDRFVLARNSRLEEALRELLRFVFATVPDGCEVYLAAGRDLAPVSRVGSGQLTIRWQVAGRRSLVGADAATGGTVIPMHPIPADADELVNDSAARSLRAAFAGVDWDLRLAVLTNGCELIAHARAIGGATGPSTAS